MSVISGTARPHNAPNAWRSDPGHPLEQWLQLDWHEPQEIGSIHLSFAGNLLREYDQTPEMWSDPQTVRDYCILAKTETGWHEVVAQTGNGLPRRVHELPHAVTTTALRLVVQATNGDPSAAVYEVRCYGPDQ